MSDKIAMLCGRQLDGEFYGLVVFDCAELELRHRFLSTPIGFQHEVICRL